MSKVIWILLGLVISWCISIVLLYIVWNTAFFWVEIDTLKKALLFSIERRHFAQSLSPFLTIGLFSYIYLKVKNHKIES